MTHLTIVLAYYIWSCWSEYCSKLNMQSFLFIKIHCILEGFDEIKLIKSAQELEYIFFVAQSSKKNSRL
jgi:hypothetical protein